RPCSTIARALAVPGDVLVPVDLAQVDVRVEPTALPFQAPAPNTAVTWNGRDVLWLGPDEWFVVGEPADEGAIVDDLTAALAGHHRSIVVVSANRIVFDLDDALAALSSGCGLDLDPARFPPGTCAQTLFGQAQVILHQGDERTTRLFARPSFAGYVGDRLRAARVT
ncbi:MAG: sarcosine oxidase subunit gamma, partial [Actinomycetota bacterium]